ncbi:sigma-70 family RNA polymerase sigma factor [Dactylosporangium aurantiacum]|uniref:Sigma-70 family RNA polymerase sigma factor n=1 Tax=Dactylosporangium aurantiacum TaxID=35754 RepID=A0A9Q9I7K7_9ACTN|nr:sigma-70 family RNA polymerase sigma factor [Dactylosporangium aurantiacum]MDG6107342.1 sigma-70 family RNA polymerase sigma factor [Dactylosporangium aurantiacum]UWZ51134.1 sigma-70 family RNA polymerase sigma factor [Dactylosporangium aurantiacum]
MQATRPAETTLVIQAQTGDRRALDELLASSLPLVYSIIGRALGGHPDVDDAVQDTMLRAMRQLPALREPDSYRSWLTAIAVRQVGTYQRRGRRLATRTAELDAAAGLPDAAAEFERLTDLRVALSQQRRQVTRAGSWLDPDDQALLALWWLEVAGELTRAEVGAGTGTRGAHTRVRIQRMRTRLEAARSIVAALERPERCPALDRIVAAWDGRPSPLWRKRLGRHVRSCPACAAAGADFLPTERLLAGFALLAVPMSLTATILGKLASGTGITAAVGAATSGGVGAGVQAGLLGRLAGSVAAHPVAAALAAGALIAGGTVTVAARPQPRQPPPAAAAPAPPATPRTARPPAPTPASTAATRSGTAGTTPPASAAGALRPGRVSLEAANQAGQFVTFVDTVGMLAGSPATTDVAARQRATFQVVPGLADPACFSFRAGDGQYLRHSSWRLRLFADDGSALFRGDVTFCPRQGSTAASVSLESSNYPRHFIRHRGEELWVALSDDTAAFVADSSFVVRSPLAP